MEYYAAAGKNATHLYVLDRKCVPGPTVKEKSKRKNKVSDVHFVEGSGRK